MARRQRGVTHRKDGRWQAKFKVEETGKYKYLYAATEKEVNQKLEEAKFQQKQGILATGPQQTVKQFLVYWLEDVEKPTIRLGTYINNHAILVHKHLIPGLGHHKLQKLTAQHVQSFYAKNLKNGASAGYIRKMHGVLHKALTHAKRLKLIGSNVTEDVQLPKYEAYDAPVLTPEQAQLLLQKARERNLEVLLALAVTTGMRRGEILALRWSDIDLVKGTLQVSRTLSYYAKHGFVEGKPKTKSSERTILLPPFLLDLLKAHNILEVERKLKAGDAWVDRDLVFSDAVGDFIFPLTLLNWFYRLLEEAGLPRMRFHDLRHSAATILISQGVPANMVQELLGHSDVAITLGIYGAVVPSMRKDAADKMDSLFGEKTSGEPQNFEGYSPETGKCLETLLSVYGADALQLAIDAIEHL
jgi:integrase